DGQEEVLTGLALDLRLPRDRLDRRAADEPVTDGSAGGATGEGQAAADQSARDADRIVEAGVCCHLTSSSVGRCRRSVLWVVVWCVWWCRSVRVRAGQCASVSIPMPR